MKTVYECGSCGHYHLAPLTGNLYLDDCRNDGNRFTFMDLDRMFGEDGWEEISVEEQMAEEPAAK